MDFKWQILLPLLFFFRTKVLHVLCRYKVKRTFSATNIQNKGVHFVALLTIIL